jgi:ATPase subunit of ABC transporter with duplicated ATPase domains
LEAALEAYEGTIITVSHDRFFLDRIATQILALDGEGQAEHYNGDYTEYHNWKAAKSVRGSAAGSNKVTESKARPSPEAHLAKRSVGKKSKRARMNSQLSVGTGGPNPRVRVIKKPRAPEAIESEIVELEKRMADLSAEMTKPEVAHEITKLVAVNNAYQQEEARLAELYDEWERAELAVTLKR